jgi:hypothetical protein
VLIINTNQRERSIARNTGAAIARKISTFLDDDDWLFPTNELFKELSAQSDAAWLYGSSQLVDWQGNLLMSRSMELMEMVYMRWVNGSHFRHR